METNYCPKCASERVAYRALGIYLCHDCGTEWEILLTPSEANPKPIELK
jgi:ribosomal protein L37AE/L43A